MSKRRRRDSKGRLRCGECGRLVKARKPCRFCKRLAAKAALRDALLGEAAKVRQAEAAERTTLRSARQQRLRMICAQVLAASRGAERLAVLDNLNVQKVLQ